MKINTIAFTKLEKELTKTKKSPLDYLAAKIGKVYVINITRQECPSCQKQKPKLNKLATTIANKHGNKVVFTQIHINYHPNSPEESQRSKTLLHHYFYPTTKILIKTPDQGPIELYKNIEPNMNELKHNIQTILEIATTLKEKQV